MQENASIALLTTKSLPDLVCAALEKWIITGKVQPGEPLREADISQQMGLSRGPVREAFRILEERGLVLCEKNRGVRVASLTMPQVEDIYEIRETLEGLIGFLAASRATAEDKRGFQTLLQQMAQAVDKNQIDLYTSFNFQLHEKLVESTKNPVLVATYQRLVARLQLFRSYSLRHKAGNAARSYKEHKAIIDAICSGKADRAQNLLRLHTQKSLQHLHEMVESSLLQREK